LFFDYLKIWESIKDANILHMAPESKFGELVKNSNPSLYVRGDLFPLGESIQKIDLERVPFPDETFDVVICNHVLEHVTTLTTALLEVHRVLKPGGRFICQTPFASGLNNTFEEPLLQTESDRLFFYGQEDHVRLFGLDIERLIVEAGFIGRLVPHEEILPEIDPELLGVNEKEPFFDFVRGYY
jgi:SAM-dependent methyltransferase